MPRATAAQPDLPHDADPKQLEEVLNARLQNEDKVPFAFYAADAEITGTASTCGSATRAWRPS